MTSAIGQSRYSFTAQFVAGAALLAERASVLQQQVNPDSRTKVEHKACVVSSIIQAASALEAEVAELWMHGPGHHLGSSEANSEMRTLITEPISRLVERAQGVLVKYDALFQLLRKPPQDTGKSPYQDADLLLRLRNELVHYKSEWSDGMTDSKLAKVFRSKGTIPTAPTSFNPRGDGFFPDCFLSAGCAEWAAKTAAAFLDDVYIRLNVTSVLDGHRLPGAEFESIMPPRVG